MSALRELQRAFYVAISEDDAGPVAGSIRADGIAPQDRLRIYRNNADIVFVTALTASFPVIERLGGAEWFRQVALRYRRRCPARSGDLQHVGDRFAAFLDEELAGSEHHYFADVARLEWAHQDVLTASDGPTLDPAALANVAAADHARLVFEPRAALRLVESKHPIFAIWRAHQGDADPAPVSLDSGPCRVLVVRTDSGVEFRELSAVAAALLNQFLRGARFAEGAGQVLAHHTEAEFTAAFRELLALPVIAGFHVDPNE